MMSDPRVSSFVCTSPDCLPLCDFCQFYRFNGNEHGAYMDEGECAHPDHPGLRDPADACADYVCALRADADPVQVAAHMASERRVNP